MLRVDDWLGWTFYGLGRPGSRGTLETIVTLTLSFIVFTFGSLLVAIQIAGGQLTPRIIATTLLRDNVVRYSVGLFVFSLLFAEGALIRTETVDHELPPSSLRCSASEHCSFLYLIDYAARLLRPVSIVARVSEHGLAVIENVYPDDVHADPSWPRRVNRSARLGGSSITREGRKSSSP